jgi:hypothetical protein
MFVDTARNIHYYIHIFIDVNELYKLILIGDINKNAEVTLLLLTSKLRTSTRILVHN